MEHTTDVRSSTRDAEVLWWGGLAGILGGVLAVLSLFVIPRAPAAAQAIATFPTLRTAWLVGDALYLSAFVLFVVLLLALYRALREASLAPALFGTGVGLVGIALLATGGMTGIVLSQISHVSHASGATAQDQATLALSWQAVDAVFTETDTVGGMFLAVGFVLLGLAMLRSHRFGRVLAGVEIALGLAALAGIAVISIGQDNPNDYAFALLVLVLPLLLGLKLCRLSRSLTRSA